MLPRIRPMRLRLVKEPFDDPDYTFELKHDGFRATAYIDQGDCRLESRNLKSLPFKYLAASLAALTMPNAILDGEIIVPDNKGVSQFNALLTTKGRDMAVFYAFDLIWMNGNDFRRTPLVERKAMLSEFVRRSRCPRLLYAQHIDGTGKQFFREICARDLQGVVAKRKKGMYREDRPDWVKIKNRSYSQIEGRHELLIEKRRAAK
jgi:bifunctional non-homologous end joining protein LigD